MDKQFRVKLKSKEHKRAKRVMQLHGVEHKYVYMAGVKSLEKMPYARSGKNFLEVVG